MTAVDPACDASEHEVFVFPASFAQQRLWLLDQLIPESSCYTVPTVIRLQGTVNFAALEASFNEIVRRHEGLRTTFDTIDGQPVQVIAPRLHIALPLLDLRNTPAADRRAIAQQRITAEIERPFNLAQGPLLRLLLLQLDDLDYVLVVTLHHIVFDEWSIALLVRELSVLYPALSAGEPSPLPELPIQYADFAHWQRDWLQGEVLHAQLAYWRQQLKDLPPLDLPTTISQPGACSGATSDRGATHLVEISQEVMSALEALSQQAGTTLFMTLLAAFQTLLFRYTGQTDIAVGSPIANRNRRELEDVIGFFANTLVLRTDLSGNPTFRELLSRVRQVAVEAYAHQDVPFEKLVAELHPERHLSRNPLFQTVFAVQNAPMQQLTLPGLTLSSFQVETTTARFDLELYLWESASNFRSLWGQGWQQAGGLRGVLVYRCDLFDQATIARLVQHWQILLAGAAANPDMPLADLPLMSAPEQHQLWVEWNQTQRPYPADCCIHQVFEAQAAQHPTAIAVRFGPHTFTYADLNSGSNQLAHYLRQRGVGPDTIVGLCMDPSPAMVAGLLGILKAGGAYLPLDPTYPAERLQFMLQDANVSLLLTQGACTAQFEGEGQSAGLQVICLDRDWAAIAQASDTNLTNQATPDSLAYVVYTSGSTGAPKGVAVPHRAVNRLVCNSNYITLHPDDRVAQCAPLAFDAATFELWGALLNGAQVIGIDREVLLSPAAFISELQRQQISVLFLTTALFNQIVREDPAAFRSLRYLLFGGETADVRSVQAVLRHGAPEHLLHVYGPTENTTFTSWYAVTEVPATATTIPIGKPIANTQIYLLDAYLNPVPLGVTGELYIGGDGLARGYLNQPALTTERFIQHPSFGRLYRSGDLARYLPDGHLEFLGRVDRQVKLRGFRIELEEIEALITQHPAVQAAIVLLRQEGGLGPQLVAYLVADPLHPWVIQEVRNYLKKKLPAYMMPAAFVPLSVLPLTPNGKVDRQALPPPNQAKMSAVSNLGPRSSLEAELAQLWMDLLGLEAVGMHDNFFDLGGHSLLATQLLSRIRDRLQVPIPLRTLFETPTIAGLAQYIAAVRGVDQDVSCPTPSAAAQVREEVEF